MVFTDPQLSRTRKYYFIYLSFYIEYRSLYNSLLSISVVLFKEKLLGQAKISTLG